ncbi:MAG: hypothetical protein N2578_03220, partial [Bdellovibrionaceae bacterium]|nr:hypothetical protein [Pseudobdellovibrionaceae bacterium]
MRVMFSLLILFFSSLLQAQNLEELRYFLAVDRLHYYATYLADHIEKQGDLRLSQEIRSLRPLELFNLQASLQDLDNPTRWNALLREALNKKGHQVSINQLRWDYNFFRNKLSQGFKLNTRLKLKIPSPSQIPQGFSLPESREYPVVIQDSSPVLLDTERYIAEKTSRGYLWWAQKNKIPFEAHIGTEADFLNTLAAQGREILAAIEPIARNYNKIYVVRDPKNDSVSIVYSRLSGADRVSHLAAQYVLTNFVEQATKSPSSLKVFGRVDNFHRNQEAWLTWYYKHLPKADIVVIGQKGAFESALEAAVLLEELKAKGVKDNLLEKLKDKNLFEAVFYSSELKKLAEKFGVTIENNSFLSIEMPSHDISDYVIKSKNGLQRWRLVSNVWGDEVIPIAKSLKASGHRKFYYIGTAGALLGGQLKVGDIFVPSEVYTQSSKLLPLSSPDFSLNGVMASGRLAQVRSPFQETEKWYKSWSPHAQAVELEVGYLREALGNDVFFRPYLLISDVVGSKGETLAEAGHTSSRRKRSQIGLVSSLLRENGGLGGIKPDLTSAAGDAFARTFEKISELRSSREMVSRFSLAVRATSENISSQAKLIELIESEPQFRIEDLRIRLQQISTFISLVRLENKLERIYLVGPHSILHGYYNPKLKEPTVVTLMLSEQENLSVSRIKEIQDRARNLFAGRIEFEILPFDETELMRTRFMTFNESAPGLFEIYERRHFNGRGFILEVNNNGGLRMRRVPELRGSMR